MFVPYGRGSELVWLRASIQRSGTAVVFSLMYLLRFSTLFVAFFVVPEPLQHDELIARDCVTGFILLETSIEFS